MPRSTGAARGLCRARLPGGLDQRSDRGHGPDVGQHLQGLQGQARRLSRILRALSHRSPRLAGRAAQERRQQPRQDPGSCALAFYADASHGLSGKRGCLVVSSANDLALFDEEAANQIKTAAAIGKGTHPRPPAPRPGRRFDPTPSVDPKAAPARCSASRRACGSPARPAEARRNGSRRRQRDAARHLRALSRRGIRPA